MSLYAPPLPWLSKPTVVREAVAAVVASAVAARADLAVLDFAGGSPHWAPPARGNRSEIVDGRLADTAFAPETTLERLTCLPRASIAPICPEAASSSSSPTSSRRRRPPPGWRRTARGWDVVPVVIQDPLWDRSFPEVGGAALPIADPATGAVSLVRLSRRETAARRAENVARSERLRGRARVVRLARGDALDDRPGRDRPCVHRVGRGTTARDRRPVRTRAVVAGRSARRGDSCSRRADTAVGSAEPSPDGQGIVRTGRRASSATR